MREIEVTIEALGGEADGLARHGGKRIVVPMALPGERHRVRLGAERRGTVEAVSVACLEPRPRLDAVCPHFGVCGGCVAQHLPQGLERAWKVEGVARALHRRGLDPSVTLAHVSPLASRRRVRVALGWRKGALVIGYRARRSHDVFDVEACPIAVPAAVSAIARLRDIVPRLETAPEETELTAYDVGVEAVFRAHAAPTLGDRERLAAWAEAADLARVAWRAGGEAEPLIERRAPLLTWHGTDVVPPPGAFLQATADGEAFLQAQVAMALAGCRRVADLYAGLGTLTAAVRATGADVRAYERDRPSVAALNAAAGAGAAEVRDLDRSPLSPADLAHVEAVVLDPPRRGAETQCRQLAASTVGRVVYVSCSPTSFARDAAVLVEAGFGLREVFVVDQFRFAAEVELVARLEREKRP